MKPSNPKYTQPPTRKSGYAFVAAGNLFRNFGGIMVYVKHKAGRANEIVVKDIAPSYLWLSCPDREILIVRTSYDTEAFYPYGESFDECHNFSTFNDYTVQKLGIEYVMTNYAHSKAYKVQRRNSTVPDKQRVQVLSDSGGLQLIRNTTTLIHPADLGEFYCNNVDAGMTLDIPLPMFDDDALLAKAAKLQRENSNILLKVGNGYELINILHGHSTESRKKFRDIVEDPRIPRCAIGDVYNESIITAMDSIVTTTLEGMRYKQYHVLGTFVASMVPLLVKIANYGDNPPHITSDSTSHIQSAANKAYHFQFDIFHTSMRIPIGSRESMPNTLRKLPCQCAVCSVIKYTDILGFGPNQYTTELLAIHNAAEMARYSQSMQEACRSLTSREYLHLVERQLGDHKRKNLQDVKMGLDFIEIAVDKGIKAARTKYKTHINHKKLKVDPVPAKGLFGTVQMKEDKPKESLSDRSTRLMGMMQAMENNIKEFE